MDTTYHENLSTTLTAKPFLYDAIDLFSGCGGLSLGFEAHGIRTMGYEMNADYAKTYNANLRGGCTVRRLGLSDEYPSAPILIGGPPCQPFSVFGKQAGRQDSRDGFPVFIDAVRRLKPAIWMFENVRGMLYKNREYFDSVIQTLSGMGYTVDYRLLNAAHFGVPQKRERLFVVGHHGGFQFPEPQAVNPTVHDAIGDIINTPTDKDIHYLTPSMDAYIAKYEKASHCANPRDMHMDKPSRTLTCRNLAGNTGDMQRITLADGRRRKLTVREAARIQSFPDWFIFHGSESSQYYQIGNSVPPMLAYALAQSVRQYMDTMLQVSS